MGKARGSKLTPRETTIASKHSNRGKISLLSSAMAVQYLLTITSI